MGALGAIGERRPKLLNLKATAKKRRRRSRLLAHRTAANRNSGFVVPKLTSPDDDSLVVACWAVSCTLPAAGFYVRQLQKISEHFSSSRRLPIYLLKL